MNQLKKFKKRLLDLRMAATHRHFSLPPELRSMQQLDRAIDTLQTRWPLSPEELQDTERPVFIFSAGWRSGSTLLQRLVVSSGEVGLWGEPLGATGMIPKLAHSLSSITSDWPPENFFRAGSDVNQLKKEWIANMTPEMAFLRRAHRRFLKEWLGSPVFEKFGIERWGFKEVRLNIQHARYLKWLFPGARFLFIYRNAHDAYRSWKGNRWVSDWPGYYSRAPIVFARHWCLLVNGFLDGGAGVDAMIIKFEELVDRRIDLNRIAGHIGVSAIDPTTLDLKIGAPNPASKPKKKRPTIYERLVINAIAGATLKRAGYGNS